MRYKAVFLILFSLFLGTANANWVKVSDVDYTWGPFNIYHITLFTETGQYSENVRPLMLTLQYKKPWEGRDFAVSLARAWKNLGINLPSKEADTIINHLRRTFPDIKPEDTLHYIALEDRGYFILNDRVVSDEFTKEFSDAIAAIWLHPKMDISRQLLDPSYKPDPQSVEKPVEQQLFEEQQAAIEQEEALKAQKEAEAQQISTAEQNTSDQVIDKVEKNVEVETQTANANEVVKSDTETSEKTNEGIINAETSTQVEQANKVENKTEDKEEKVLTIENPEVFISPIYDDILMLSKDYS